MTDHKAKSALVSEMERMTTKITDRPRMLFEKLETTFLVGLCKSDDQDIEM